MKLQIETPAHSDRRQPPGARQARGHAGRRPAHRRAGAQQRPRRRPARAHGLCGAGRALLAGASGQLRNKATTAGNLLQRTRCYYFYDPAKPCNKREPGSGCSALAGFNRIMAVVGASEPASPPTRPTWPSRCGRSTPRSRPSIRTARRGRSRSPTSTGCRATRRRSRPTCAAGELITAVTLPPPLAGMHIYRKVRDRASYAFALVSVAAVMSDARAAAQVGAARLRRPRAQALARGGGRGRRSARQPGAAPMRPRTQCSPGARGYGSNDFKIPLARRTLRAVVAQATRASPDEERRMELNAPIGRTPLDDRPDGLVGQPLDRVEARSRSRAAPPTPTSTRAAGIPPTASSCRRPSPRAASSIDAAAAEAAPGVVRC